MKAQYPDVDAVRAACIRAVKDINALHTLIGAKPPVVPKMLLLLHFWIDVYLYGDIPGFSCFPFESRQGLFARAAFKQSSGRYNEEHAILKQQCAMGMTRIAPSPCEYFSCCGEPSPPIASRDRDVPTLVEPAAVVSQRRSHGYTVRRVELSTSASDAEKLRQRLPREAREYISRHAGDRVVDKHAESYDECTRRVFTDLGVSVERVQSTDTIIRLTTLWDTFTVDVEGSTRLDWPDDGVDRARRREWRACDSKSTARVSFTLHGVLPFVSRCRGVRVCVGQRCDAAAVARGRRGS
jgi:hypothetical protein